MFYIGKFKHIEKMKKQFPDAEYNSLIDEIPDEYKKYTEINNWALFAPRKSLFKAFVKNEINIIDYYLTYKRDLNKLWNSVAYIFSYRIHDYSDKDYIFLVTGDVPNEINFLIAYFQEKEIEIKELTY